MNIAKERALIRAFEADINQAAQILALGYNPQNMLEHGYIEESQQLSFLLGRLYDNKLGPEVERRKKLIEERLHQPEQEVPPDGHHREMQLNFYDLDDQANPGEPVADWLLHSQRDPEKDINRMHVIFQKRSPLAQREREKILGREAYRDWRAFLKAIGVLTPSQKREKLSKQGLAYVALLQAIGVWEEMQHGITDKIIHQIQEALKNPPRYSTDKLSSEDVTIFSSPVAMKLKQLIDSLP